MNADIANRVLYEDFEKLEEAVNPLFGCFDANGNAKNALKLGGQLPSYYATADSLKAYQYMSKVRDFLKMLMFNSPIESYNVCSPSLVGWREVGSGKLTR
jgi:hypothetical protein